MTQQESSASDHAHPLTGDVAGPLPCTRIVRTALIAGLLFGSASLFIVLLQAVQLGALETVDRVVGSWIVANRTPTLTKIALDLTSLGSSTLLAIATVLVVVLLWTSRRRLGALDAALAASLAALITATVKAALARARPGFEHLALASGFSFPSGHTSGITALLTATGLHTIEAAGSRAQKFVLALFHVLLIVAVGWSRIYLGVHYTSDVIAGLCLGIACGLAAHGLVRTHVIVGHVRTWIR